MEKREGFTAAMAAVLGFRRRLKSICGGGRKVVPANCLIFCEEVLAEV